MDSKVVLITGSSSGIGEATALKFASLGANVVITGTDELKISGVAKKCRKVSTKTVLELKADLTSAEEAQQLVDKTIAEFGRLDILVNHEDKVTYHLATDPKLMDLFDTTIATNVRSVLQLISLSIPHLEKTKGSVVNVSSVAGIKPIPSIMTYCAAKAALDMTTRCLAIELAPKGIRVNSVNPALTRTPLLNYGGLSEDNPEEIVRTTLSRSRKFGEIEDIANAIVFLSSEKSSFITGTILPVDATNLVQQ